MARKNPANDPPAAGRRFLYWIAEAAMDARIQAGASHARVADLIGVGEPTVKRFEKARHWPADPDRVMAAYAEVAGLEDARAMYQRALDLWYQCGSKPLLSAKDDGQFSEDQRFAQAFADAQDRDRAPREREQTPTAKPKKQASN